MRYLQTPSPELLQPVSGITLQAFARAQALVDRQPDGTTPAELEAVLATVGLNPTLLEEVGLEWRRRMVADVTQTLTRLFNTAYSEAHDDDEALRRLNRETTRMPAIPDDE